MPARACALKREAQLPNQACPLRAPIYQCWSGWGGARFWYIGAIFQNGTKLHPILNTGVREGVAHAERVCACMPEVVQDFVRQQ